MEETLVDLTLSPTEVHMNNWKPIVQNILQQFADYDNEGYDMKTCLYDIVQNSKMRYYQCKEVFLFGLKFTEAPSASNWTERSVDNWVGILLPKTFEELEQIPLNQKYNFLMFWELPKVRDALNDLCKKWFYNVHQDNDRYLRGFSNQC
jgi:hypothetical protein